MSDRSKSLVAYIFSIIFTLGYVALIWIMIRDFVLVKDPVGHWDYALTIFTSVSSIAFAAVGVLLGTTVQQVNVANARSDKAAAEANQAKMKQIAANALKNSAGQTPRGGGGPTAQEDQLLGYLQQIVEA